MLASTFPARDGDGTPPFVRDLARYQARHFDTLVLVPRVPGGAAVEEVSPTLRIERFAYFPRAWETLADGAILDNVRARPVRAVQVPAFLGAEARAVRAAVRRFRPDAIHVHWLLPQGVVALAAARGVPTVVTTLGGDVYALRDPFSRALKRAVLARVDAVTAMTPDMHRRLLDLGAPPERTHVIPVGADVESVRRLAAGIDPRPGRILFAGRLVEKKGASVLLEALRRLPPGLEWSLDVAGDGPLRASLEAEAEGLAVRFLGRRTRAELARDMAGAAVVVVPSVPAASGDQDGLPVVLMEAMSLGRCAIGSRIPGLADAIEDGVSGLLAAPGDPGALAGALERALADPALCERLGEAARRRSADFSVEATGERFVALLREAAER